MADHSAELLVSGGPHVRTRLTVPMAMWNVALALLPAGAWAYYVFGPSVAVVAGVSVAAAVLTELAIQLLLRRKVTVFDGSAVVTGLLIAYTLPATAGGQLPLYIPAVASVFAIAVAKHAFGGLGHNWINPAVAGRLFVFFAWLGPMTGNWAAPLAVDAASQATPLAVLKFGGTQLPSYADLFLGKVGGCIGEISAAALLVGGLYLIAIRVVNWEIPLSYLGSAALGAWIFGGLAAGGQPAAWFAGDPVFHLLAGGVLLGAFFMATDWVTSPLTFWGRVLFGVGCGALTVLIRLTGRNVEGVMFSIAIMNIAVPLIDRIFKPRRFGLPKESAA